MTTPCPDEGISVPAIEYGDGAAAAEFFAFSEFWYSMEDVLKMGGPYSPAALKKAARVRREVLAYSLSQKGYRNWPPSIKDDIDDFPFPIISHN